MSIFPRSAYRFSETPVKFIQVFMKLIPKFMEVQRLQIAMTIFNSEVSGIALRDTNLFKVMVIQNTM